MPTPTELALATLLPTVSFLPPELVALANSLLLQSRAKAATLKPEEEIGRTYACAHIACQRLAKRLDFEIEKPKPPCKPKVYQKIYTYLDSALGTPRTPTAPRTRDALQGNRTPTTRPGGTPPVRTPTSSVAGTGGRKRTRDVAELADEDATPRPKAGVGAAVTEAARHGDALPASVTALARTLCRATSTPHAAPHLLDGARAVQAEIESRAAPAPGPASDQRRRGARGRGRRTPRSAEKPAGAIASVDPAPQPAQVSVSIQWPAMILALHAITCARMRGREMSDARVHALRREGVAAAVAHAGEGTAAGLEKDVAFYLLEAEDCGWMEMSWYHNIPAGAAESPDGGAGDAEGDDAFRGDETPHLRTPRKTKAPAKTPLRRKEKHGGREAVGSRGDGGENESENPAGLRPGLGTMFQPAVDWLSEERRAEYRAWKEDIMEEIVAMEAGTAC